MGPHVHKQDVTELDVNVIHLQKIRLKSNGVSKVWKYAQFIAELLVELCESI